MWNHRRSEDRKQMGKARAFAIAAALLLVAADRPASAQPVEDPNWPCVQRKVPEISPGQVWTGPSLEPVQDAWQKDRTIADLVTRIASRRTSMDEAKAAIDQFAGPDAADPDRERRLTTLFAGILETINHDRASIISGIERYAARQRSLAEKIERQTDELESLPADGTPEQVSERADLQEIQNWDIRIFEERERALTYVCEQPVLLEQRAFALGREIVTHLD